MRTVNKWVACTPFPTNDVVIEAKGGIPSFKQRKELTKLTVVYDTDDGEFTEGEAVYLMGDSCKHPQANVVYEIEEGKKFVLVPYEFVRVVDE